MSQFLILSADFNGLTAKFDILTANFTNLTADIIFQKKTAWIKSRQHTLSKFLHKL